MTTEFWLLLAGAFVVGMVFSRGLFALWPQKPVPRFVFLILFPLIIVGVAPMIRFGLPAGEDWIWLMLIYTTLAPIIAAWWVGVLAEVAIRRLRASGA